MAALVRVILSGRLAASLVAAALFLITLLVPVVGGVAALAAAAPAAVIAWHVGGRGLVEVGLIGAALIGLATWQWLAPVFWLVALWAPVGAGALVLRRGPLFAPVGLGMVLAILGGLGIWTALLGGDPQALVQERVAEALRSLVTSQAPQEEAGRVMEELRRDAIPTLGRFLPGIVGAGILLTWWVNVLVGLRLAGSVDALPELGDSLRSFRLPDSGVWLLVGLGLVTWLAAGTPLGYWAGNGLVVATMLFLAQGLAVVHAARLAFGIARGWLVLFYVLIGLFLQVVVAVILLGLADVWADFRSKIKTT